MQSHANSTLRNRPVCNEYHLSFKFNIFEILLGNESLLAKQTTKSYHSLLALKRPTQYRLNTFGRLGLAREEIENEHTTISGPDIRCS